MRANCREFVKIISEIHRLSPVVEFGSKILIERDNPNLRELFPADYTGCDVTSGRGVDVVDDITHSRIRDGYVGTAIACDMLEHVAKIWKAIEESRRILSPTGLFIATLPSMGFPIHHPPDYWRVTPQCMDMLMEPFEHHSVLFQGRLAIPHTIMAIGSPSESVHAEVLDYLKQEAHRIPSVTVKKIDDASEFAYAEDDMLRLWINQELYCRDRHEEAKSGVTYCLPDYGFVKDPCAK